MNINNYKLINYGDEEPHTATVAEHIASIADELRVCCATNNDINDYIAAADYIEECGATIKALSEHNINDILTVTFRDWAGFILKDEEE